MNDKINTNLGAEESLAALICSEGFNKLSEENQQLAITGITNRNDIEGGIMGKIFGIKKENASMNIAFSICVLLAIIGCICIKSGKDYWNVIIPAITTGMGYMFGKGEK